MTEDRRGDWGFSFCFNDGLKCWENGIQEQVAFLLDIFFLLYLGGHFCCVFGFLICGLRVTFLFSLRAGCAK